MKNKIFSRVCCLALVIIMALAFCAPAFAAKDSMSNFSRVKTYSGQYSDESTFGWAYGAIKTCYETSLMQGSDGAFKPTDNLTVAQALVMACRVHQIYHTGSNTLTNGTPWYQTYVDYAIDNGIIKDGDFSNYNANITRADMAYIFSRALPTKEYGMINNIGEIPDLKDAPARDQDPIELLYFSGILTGSDVYGTFNPTKNITRAEAAAIISRVAIPSERKNITLLYKVQDGIVTFGIPQTGFLTNNPSNGENVYQASGSAIASYVHIEKNSSIANLDLTQQITASKEKEIYEAGGFYDVSVTKTSFGSINAYCLNYKGNYSGNVIESFCYMFCGPEGMYSVNVSWGADADRSEVQTIINNVLVNGVAASPAYTL